MLILAQFAIPLTSALMPRTTPSATVNSSPTSQDPSATEVTATISTVAGKLRPTRVTMLVLNFSRILILSGTHGAVSTVFTLDAWMTPLGMLREVSPFPASVAQRTVVVRTMSHMVTMLSKLCQRTLSSNNRPPPTATTFWSSSTPIRTPVDCPTTLVSPLASKYTHYLNSTWS